MDRVRPLTAHHVIGRLTPQLEEALRNPDIAAVAARRLVEPEFPPTIAPDVLMAVGLDPDSIMTMADKTSTARRRRGSWATTILTAWDRQCAFCGFDGQLGAATVGVEAAHIRSFTFDRPQPLRPVSCFGEHALIAGVVGAEPTFPDEAFVLIQDRDRG